MVARCHEQLTDIIIFQRLHSLDSLSATVLTLERIHRHSLDVTKFCHGNHNIFPWNQIFHGNIKLVISDTGSSVISVFFRNHKNFFFNYT